MTSEEFELFVDDQILDGNKKAIVLNPLAFADLRRWSRNGKIDSFQSLSVESFLDAEKNLMGKYGNIPVFCKKQKEFVTVVDL